MMILIDETEKEIIECWFDAWQNDAALYGNLSYQQAIDLAERFDIDTTKIRATIQNLENLNNK